MQIANSARQVVIIGLAATISVSVVISLLLSDVIVRNGVQRDARVSMEFVQSIAAVERPEAYFLGNAGVDSRITEFFQHIASMPHVVRANVFSTNRQIIWSSDAKLVGLAFGHNPELDAALLGRLEVSNEDVHWKPEHMLLGIDEERFVETYLPVLSAGKVIGVVEVYKSQRSLFESLHQELRIVWLCSALGAALLYGLVLLSLARPRRHHRTSDTDPGTVNALAGVEVSVAGIATPLASIRSRAELGLESRSRQVREASEDILFEVGRIERFVLGAQGPSTSPAELDVIAAQTAGSRPLPLRRPPQVSQET
jgi:two-component system sensor histidine kinase HydH